MSQPPAGSSARKPAVLFVYYTYTQQTLKVAEEMAGVLRRRGCDVHLTAIEFTDPRYAGRFSQFPMPHPNARTAWLTAWRASLAETRSTRGSSDCADVHIAADACVAER